MAVLYNMLPGQCLGQGCLRGDIPPCGRSSRYGGEDPPPTRVRGPGNSQRGGDLKRGLCV